MRLADAEGLAAVTMRRVASELGVEAMSLYYHLPGKDSLLDGLVEAILAEIGTAIGATTNDGQEWDAALRRRCLTAREVMLRHRWAPALIGSRTAIPVPLYAYYEEILTTLVGGGFSYHLAHRAIHALGSMVLGFTQELFSPAAGGEAPSDEDTEAAMAEMAAALPHLTAMVTAELHDHQDDPLGWCDSQAEFEFTLDLLLEGLARRT
ncbi:MAG: TetR/AcrR family transcriptional regulator [Kineosporiaceae bacterium]|nr:TetR/AcrR family transcriptional regulator [Kineosporiaceae bacterium]MBK7624809.1 TetR/AcrR family transcriptional regulator [Kineosporiaceae bacterium]MBK8076814.1 TetR/AcrR family transcriptional regulator [Kineosporiaceae bacterium]